MNQLPVNKPFPRVLDEASTSSVSRDDRQEGSSSLQKLARVALEKLTFGQRLHKIDLNPVRMVSV